MRILGIDEAGRGCVLGPLVIAGVMIYDKSRYMLKDLGVRDSKLVTRIQRRQLAAKIRKISVETHVMKICPAEIDKAVKSNRKLHKLNRLEAKAMANMIEVLRPDIAIVDASDVLPKRYKHHIQECLSFPVQVISEHKADRNYPVVSAASIIAKVERDLEIDKLRAKYGNFGSGYMSDRKTAAFLQALASTGAYPDFVRSSWKPARLALNNAKRKQCQLGEAAIKA